ncbi:MAG: DUF5615 family PIN-like protein [Planctomycetaceae bacterium]|nr:DUF5615 family PIN-like protein [Planctomycetaceae bacterium]
MKLLFDQGTPAPLRNHLDGHDLTTVYEAGWSQLENGDLLEAAEKDGYDVLITTDQNLKYQQNLSDRTIAIIVLKSTSWPLIQNVVTHIVDAVNGSSPGDYLEISIQ